MWGDTPGLYTYTQHSPSVCGVTTLVSTAPLYTAPSRCMYRTPCLKVTYGLYNYAIVVAQLWASHCDSCDGLYTQPDTDTHTHTHTHTLPGLPSVIQTTKNPLTKVYVCMNGLGFPISSQWELHTVSAG